MIYYLGASFSKETKNQLHHYRLKNNLELTPLPSLGFHTTIVYSRQPFIYTLHTLPGKQYRTGTIDLLGTSLVLMLPIQWLHDQHQMCLLNGATHDYEYTPHITIAEQQEQFPDIIDNTPISVEITGLFYREW